MGPLGPGFVLPSLYGLGLTALGMELLALESAVAKVVLLVGGGRVGRLRAGRAVAAGSCGGGVQPSLAGRGHLPLRTRRGRCPWHPAKPQASNAASGKNMLDAFGWFAAAQAVVVAVAAGLAAWIALDYGFDQLGRHVALLAHASHWPAGRRASSRLLMLLAAAIVMVREAGPTGGRGGNMPRSGC